MKTGTAIFCKLQSGFRTGSDLRNLISSYLSAVEITSAGGGGGGGGGGTSLCICNSRHLLYWA